jgi:glycerophosphoryl diester phosphodiesterase
MESGGAAPSPRPSFRARRRLFLLAALALPVLGVTCLVPYGSPRPPVLPEVRRPIVFAHRGGAGEAPESTLAAFREVAARDPEAVVELDVRASRDGHIVVIHDETVDRTTNGHGRIAALTLAELQALDAGYCATPGRGTGTARRGHCEGPASDFPFRGRGHRIPKLAEVLEALPRRTIVAIEVKTGGFEEPLAQLLRASGRLPRLVLGSAIGSVGERLRSLLPEVPAYFPTGAALRLALAAKMGGRLARPGFDVLATPKSALVLSLDRADVLDTAHRLGVLVAYFIIDDEDEMERLLRLGADGLITNYPTRARRVIEELRAEGVFSAPSQR